MSKSCLNCGHDLDGKYCSNCSQPADTGRIDLKYIVHEFMHGVLHVDAGILFTAKELTLRPGQAVRSYLAGKRVNFFKPLAYLFILATVYVVLVEFTNISFFEEFVDIYPTNAVEMSVDTGVNSAAAEDVEMEIAEVNQAAEQLTNRLFELMMSRYAILNLLMLPLMALLSSLLFRKSRYNYGEHLIINAYVSGQILLFNIVAVIIAFIIPNSFAYLTIITYVFYICMYAAIFDSYKLLSSILRSVLFVLVFMAVIAVVTAAFVFVFLDPVNNG